MERIQVDPSKRAKVVQQYVLAVIFHATEGYRLHNSTQWLTIFHECDWYGIHCHYSVYHPYLKIELSELAPRSSGEIYLVDISGTTNPGATHKPDNPLNGIWNPIP